MSDEEFFILKKNDLMKFILINTNLDEKKIIVPTILKIPKENENIKKDNKKLKKIVLNIFNKNNFLVISELDCKFDIEVAKFFELIDWNLAQKVWLNEPTNFEEAFEYTYLVGPSPSLEPMISKDFKTSYKYALDILKSRFTLGEKSIGKNAYKSFNYALEFNCRIPEGEESISKIEEISFKYGKLMGKLNLWSSWKEQEISRSSVWMYQYAKDYKKGPLPEKLHNKMYMLSLSSKDKWAKKYVSTKKYQLKKVDT